MKSMNEETVDLQQDAMEMLMATSRTFFIPISHLSEGLQEAVASAYLCMRAIDEIEDHPTLPAEEKISILREIAAQLKKPNLEQNFDLIFKGYEQILPEVSLRLADWVRLCPLSISAKVYESTAIMALGMSEWIEKNWDIQNREDLDSYTYYVAGLVGVMLSDIWYWFDQTETDKEQAISFGRGLQAVNIIRNYDEDADRGVTFFPQGWSKSDMLAYARNHLRTADIYCDGIKTDSIFTFCKIPLVLAHGTLDAIEAGKEKLSREEVLALVNQVVNR